jgi:hypothetical protein
VHDYIWRLLNRRERPLLRRPTSEAAESRSRRALLLMLPTLLTLR